MDIKEFIDHWLEASNDFDADRYVSLYKQDAVLDDPSVGRKFIGHEGIRNYFESYFIGYNTQTRLKELIINGNTAHLEVEFTGNFPEGIIGGIFDFEFKDGKIRNAKADLVS